MSEKDKQRRIFEVDKEVDELVKEGDKDERWWQYHIARHPEMLETVIRDLEGIDVKLRFLGIELGGIDVLFGDNRGLLNIVETKLIGNREAKREVLAQVLDYAADLTQKKLDDLVSEIKAAAERAERKGSLSDIVGERGSEFLKLVKKLDELAGDGDVELQKIFASYLRDGKVPDKVDDKDIKGFIDRIERFMSEGSARLIIAMSGAKSNKDWSHLEAFLRVFNYFKRITSSKAQLVGVVLDRQEIGGKEYFIPHLVGSPEVLSPEYYYVERRKREYYHWELEDLYKDFRDKWETSGENVIRNFIESFANEEIAGRVRFELGEGKTPGINIKFEPSTGEKLEWPNLLRVSSGEIWMYARRFVDAVRKLWGEEIAKRVEDILMNSELMSLCGGKDERVFNYEKHKDWAPARLFKELKSLISDVLGALPS